VVPCSPELLVDYSQQELRLHSHITRYQAGGKTFEKKKKKNEPFQANNNSGGFLLSKAPLPSSLP
jgi:hypothetical protein